MRTEESLVFYGHLGLVSFRVGFGFRRLIGLLVAIAVGRLRMALSSFFTPISLKGSSVSIGILISLQGVGLIEGLVSMHSFSWLSVIVNLNSYSDHLDRVFAKKRTIVVLQPTPGIVAAFEVASIEVTICSFTFISTRMVGVTLVSLVFRGVELRAPILDSLVGIEVLQSNAQVLLSRK